MLFWSNIHHRGERDSTVFLQELLHVFIISSLHLLFFSAIWFCTRLYKKKQIFPPHKTTQTRITKENVVALFSSWGFLLSYIFDGSVASWPHSLLQWFAVWCETSSLADFCLHDSNFRARCKSSLTEMQQKGCVLGFSLITAIRELQIAVSLLLKFDKMGILSMTRLKIPNIHFNIF